MPRRSRASISSIRNFGSTTTPLPITGVVYGVEDAAREQLEGEALAVHDDGVAGVVPSLVAHDDLHLFGQQVGQFSFTFVTPLGAYQDGRGHACAPFEKVAAATIISPNESGPAGGLPGRRRPDYC